MCIRDSITGVNADAVANAMINQLITYDANSSGEIKTVTFYQSSDEDDNTLYLAQKGTLSYDEVDKELGKYAIDEDTVVFFITNEGKNVAFGNKANLASKTASKVGKMCIRDRDSIP